jgi:hypothetical protein
MTKQFINAQGLFEQLLQLHQEHGSLDIPISIFVNGDRMQIEDVDVFYDNGNKTIHSIDLNAKNASEEMPPALDDIFGTLGEMFKPLTIRK